MQTLRMPNFHEDVNDRNAQSSSSVSKDCARFCRTLYRSFDFIACGRTQRWWVIMPDDMPSESVTDQDLKGYDEFYCCMCCQKHLITLEKGLTASTSVRHLEGALALVRCCRIHGSSIGQRKRMLTSKQRVRSEGSHGPSRRHVMRGRQ